jgi:hypothetical protein
MPEHTHDTHATHQLTHILACAELYFCGRAKLQAEQRALQAQLRAATEGSSAGPDALLSSSAGVVDDTLQPLLDRLASNLKVCMWCGVACRLCIICVCVCVLQAGVWMCDGMERGHEAALLSAAAPRCTRRHPPTPPPPS